jgi:site-specific recombinase XerC
MAETLRRYVIEQRGIFGSDGPMFSSRWRGFDGKRLLQRALEYIFEAAAREAGIDGEFTFRCLRDTFGRFYWLATGDALALREQLGLRTVSATIDAHCRDDVYGTAANVRRFGEMVNP